MKHVTLAEARERTDELFEEIEQGEVLTISKRGVLGETPRFDEARRQDAQKAIRELMELRKAAGKASVEEILAWRDEGRRF